MKKQIAFICVSLAAASSQAAVAFNTFGPGDTTKSFGWGFGDIRDTRIASQFTSSLTGTLSSIELKLLSSGGTPIATISLFQDSGNDIGTLMALFTVNISSGGVKTLTNSNPSIELLAGSKYWIEAKGTAGSGLYSGWCNNNQGFNGLIKFGQVSGTSANPTSTYRVGPAELPAFRVNVVPGKTLTGNLNLGDTVSSFAVARTIQYTVTQGTTVLTTGSVVSNSSTTPFTLNLPNATTGAIQVQFNGPSFLRRTTAVSFSGTTTAIGAVALSNGDPDNSGEVDAADIDLVIAAFGDVSAGVSDLDVSGEVDAADIDISIANFGSVDE